MASTGIDHPVLTRQIKHKKQEHDMQPTILESQNLTVAEEIEALRSALRKADAGIANSAISRAQQLAEGAYEAEFARSDDHDRAQAKYIETERNVLEEELCRIPETVKIIVGAANTATPAWQAWRDRFEFDAYEHLADVYSLDTTIVIVTVDDADPARYATIHSASSTHALLRDIGWDVALQEIADTVSDEVEEEFA